MAVQLRSRDQVWQLLLAVGSAATVLVVAVLMLFGDSDDETAAVGLNVSEAEDGHLVAGPSDGNAGPFGQSHRRSGGPIDGPAGRPVPASGSRSPISVETASESSRPATTERETTTETKSDQSPSKPETTVQSTTTEPPVTVPPAPEPVPPTATPGPMETLQPVDEDHSIKPKDLKKARKRWRSMDFDSYTMIVNRVCFCPNPGPLAVVVRDGELQSVTPTEGDPNGPVFDRNSLTVPELHNLIESGFEADSMRVVFDKETGIPLTIEIDYIGQAIDDELTVIVRDFQPHRDR